MHDAAAVLDDDRAASHQGLLHQYSRSCVPFVPPRAGQGNKCRAGRSMSTIVLAGAGKKSPRAQKASERIECPSVARSSRTCFVVAQDICSSCKVLIAALRKFQECVGVLDLATRSIIPFPRKGSVQKTRAND